METESLVQRPKCNVWRWIAVILYLLTIILSQFKLWISTCLVHVWTWTEFPLELSTSTCQYFQTSDAIVLTSTLTPYAYPHFASELIHPLSGKIPAKVIYPLEKFCVCTWSQSREMDNGHKRHETLVQMTKCTLWRWINFGRFQELSMD